MDPLSVTASIVALVSFAGEIILNELADFQSVISILEHGVGFPADSNHTRSPELVRKYQSASLQLENQINRANEVLKRLENLAQRVSNGVPSSGSSRDFKYLAWARCRKDFGSVQTDLRNLKNEIHLTVTILTHQNISRVSLQLCAIEAGVNQLRNPGPEDNSSATPMPVITQHGEGLQDVIHNLPQMDQAGNDIVQVTTNYSFGTSFVGVLFLGYLGGPIVQRPCSDRLCSRQSRRHTRITYFFPSWFVSLAVSVLVSGPAVSVKALPMRGKDDIIFTFASGGNSHELVRLMDAGRASPLDIDPQGWGLLHWAARFGAFKTCKMLMSLGADPGIENGSLIHSQLVSGVLETWGHVGVFKQRGRVTQEYYDVFGYQDSPKLEELEFSRLHKSLFRMLRSDLNTELEFLAMAVNQPDSKGATPLLWATQLHDAGAVRLLLLAGADPKLSDVMGTTPLHYGWSLPHVDFLNILESGGNPNALDAYNETPLHHCCRNLNEIEFIKALVLHGADPNLQDLNGWAPLHWLARYDYADSIKYLLGHGALVDPHSYVGWTPLFFCVRYNSHKSLLLLLESGASTSVVSRQGDSILHYAAVFADKTTLGILARFPMGLIDSQRRSFAWPSFKEGVTARELFEHTVSSSPIEDLRGAFEQLLEVFRCQEMNDGKGVSREEAVSDWVQCSGQGTNTDIEHLNLPGSWRF
ncbi:hypothetical protein PG990_013387 [Apiospora arundinis]